MINFALEAIMMEHNNTTTKQNNKQQTTSNSMLAIIHLLLFITGYGFTFLRPEIILPKSLGRYLLFHRNKTFKRQNIDDLWQKASNFRPC
jgi:hypothetical protein